MIDPCGVAGGRIPGQGIGGAGASFQNSSVAKMGDMGSKLPPLHSGNCKLQAMEKECKCQKEIEQKSWQKYEICMDNICKHMLI